MSKTNLRIDLDEGSTFEFLVRTEADDSGVIAAVVAEGDMGKLGVGFRSLKQIRKFRAALDLAETVIHDENEEIGMAEVYERLDPRGGITLTEDTRTLPRRHADAAHLLHERRLKDRRGAHGDEGETEGGELERP